MILSTTGPIQSPGVPFTLEQNIDRGATVKLHRAMHNTYLRSMANLGITMKPMTNEQLEKRALAEVDWHPKSKAEQESVEAPYFYRSRAQELEERGVNVDDLRKVEKHLFEMRAIALKAAGRPVPEIRALNGSDDTSLVGTDYLHEPFREIRQSSDVVALFSKQIDIPAGASSWTVPILGDAQVLKGSAVVTESYTSATAVDPSSNVVTFNPWKLQGVIWGAGEIEEDALFALMPALNESMRRGMKIALEHVILNGDTTTGTTNINAYNVTALGNLDPRLSCDGLRAMFYKGTDFGKSANTFTGGLAGGGSTISLDNFLTMRGALDVYGSDPGRTISLLPNILETDAQKDSKARPDTYSALYDASTGKLVSVGGSRIVTVGGSLATNASSSQVPTTLLLEGLPINLSSAGTYTGSGSTKTGIMFREDNFEIAWKRHYQLQVVRLPLSDQWAITATLRLDFKRLIAGKGLIVGTNWA